MDFTRTHPRFEIDAPALLSFIGLEDQRLEAKVHDVSLGGVKLSSAVPVALGEIVRVEIAEDVLVGVVRNSEGGDSENIVGIELLHWISKSKLDELLLEWAPVLF